jgi:hypothetical protein
MAGFAPDTGTSLGSIFIKLAGDARARFAEVAIFDGDTVTRLAKRASVELDWRTSAAYVELFLVPAESEDALAAGEVGPEALILATRPLSSIKALSAVGILNRSCLLARLTDPPAAAPGESVRETASLLSCSSSWRAKRLVGACWDSTGAWGATPFSLASRRAARTLSITAATHPSPPTHF